MSVWIIEPRDPLIVRDGRPFDPVPGARAVSLPFPFPSTTTGGVRTREGLDPAGRFEPDVVSRVKQVSVRGPLLVELDPIDGDVTDWLMPAPADALLLNLDPPDPRASVLEPLVPLELPPGAATELPQGLAPVGMPRPDLRKPSGNAPRYWRWRFFEQWLLDPRGREVTLAELGHNGPILEARMHVGIKSDTRTADEERGALFQTRGLEFAWAPAHRGLAAMRQLALAVATEATNLKPGIGPLGGERRLVFWRRSRHVLPPIPDAIKQGILVQRHCRLILLTPAHFRVGWKPLRVLEPRQGAVPSLRAAALHRPKVVSGWDFEGTWPKPTRLLVPAGTVFFLKLEGSSQAVENWIDTVWMYCVSDEEQDRRDGFGLAALGLWDGAFHRMEV